MEDIITVYLYHNDLPDNLTLSGDLAIDTETLGLHHTRDRLCVVQLSNGDGNAHLVHFEKPDYSSPNLRKLLLNPNACKIFHFARFDIAALEHSFNIKLENIYCTKIASKLARTYSESHGLKELCKELLNIQLSKQQQSSYWGTAALSKEQLEYAANDVLYLHELRDKLNVILEREGRMEFLHKCLEFLPHRARLDLAGWSEIDIFIH
jgi:ribonuclease D